MIFDTHTHINTEELRGQAKELVKNAKELGVNWMAVVGFDEETIQVALDQAAEFEGVYAIIGWHPTEAGTYTDQVEEKLYHLLQDERVVACGEMGLDYYWDTAPRQVQKEVFRRQIRLAKELKLPVSIHNREATKDVYQILKEEHIGDTGGIMHSFNQDPEWLERFLDIGMHISYSGVVTFKNAPEVKESAKLTPNDRILVETDAPYLAPVPYRGKRNQPAYTRYVAEEVARLKEMPLEEFAKASTENAFRLFGLEEA